MCATCHWEVPANRTIPLGAEVSHITLGGGDPSPSQRNFPTNAPTIPRLHGGLNSSAPPFASQCTRRRKPSEAAQKKEKTMSTDRFFNPAEAPPEAVPDFVDNSPPMSQIDVDLGRRNDDESEER